jgi:hypothetical protein
VLTRILLFSTFSSIQLSSSFSYSAACPLFD